jgi:hypothetical protein
MRKTVAVPKRDFFSTLCLWIVMVLCFVAVLGTWDLPGVRASVFYFNYFRQCRKRSLV